VTGSLTTCLLFLEEFPTVDDWVNNGKINGVRYESGFDKEIFIPYEGGHDGFRESNPFLNGTFNKDEIVKTAQSTDGIAKRYADITGGTTIYGSQPANPWKAPEKKRGHAWAPQFGATVFLTDNTRIYARYSQFARFANLFEATQAAYGWGKGSTLGDAATKPERAYNLEIGYAHDFANYFPSLHYADFRINYFKNIIKDYMDRDYRFNIVHGAEVD